MNNKPFGLGRIIGMGTMPGVPYVNKKLQSSVDRHVQNGEAFKRYLIQELYSHGLRGEIEIEVISAVDGRDYAKQVIEITGWHESKGALELIVQHDGPESAVKTRIFFRDMAVAEVCSLLKVDAGSVGAETIDQPAAAGVCTDCDQIFRAEEPQCAVVGQFIFAVDSNGCSSEDLKVLIELAVEGMKSDEDRGDPISQSCLNTIYNVLLEQHIFTDGGQGQIVLGRRGQKLAVKLLRRELGGLTFDSGASIERLENLRKIIADQRKIRKLKEESERETVKLREAGAKLERARATVKQLEVEVANLKTSANEREESLIKLRQAAEDPKQNPVLSHLDYNQMSSLWK